MSQREQLIEFLSQYKGWAEIEKSEQERAINAFIDGYFIGRPVSWNPRYVPRKHLIREEGVAFDISEMTRTSDYVKFNICRILDLPLTTLVSNKKE